MGTVRNLYKVTYKDQGEKYYVCKDLAQLQEQWMGNKEDYLYIELLSKVYIILPET